MTKQLVKSSTEIELVDSDFSARLEKSLDLCMATFADKRCELEAEHVGNHVSGTFSWTDPQPIISIDTETFEWDNKKRFDERFTDEVDSGSSGIVRRIESTKADFRNMKRKIRNEWARLFGGESMREIALTVANKTIAQAQKLGVPPTASTSISPCGCVWALQTQFNAGYGDVILRTCAVHVVKKKSSS